MQGDKPHKRSSRGYYLFRLTENSDLHTLFIVHEPQKPISEISSSENSPQPSSGKRPPSYRLQPPLDPSRGYYAPKPSGLSRRKLLASSAATAGVAYVASQTHIPSPAAAAVPATGTPADLKHVVVFMQENRSYDHFYGVLKGARGFDDKQVLEYPDGSNIFTQHYTGSLAFVPGAYSPFHMNSARYNAQNADSLDHTWEGTHKARNNGAWNSWVTAKKPQTMGHFSGEDLPFHYALLSQYTLFDHYHCSLLGGTTPNRLYQWTANIDPFGRAGGPIFDNPLADHDPILSWLTYPELLQDHGISWKLYANDEVGDADKAPYVGDYGDNPLWLFHKYHDSLNSSDPRMQALAKNAGLHHGWKINSGRGWDTSYLLQDFIEDCKNGTLPKVSYIVAPYGWCEHPKASPDYGAHYSNTVINAIYANPEIARSTALIMNYDENDGFFDHLLPPTPEKEYTDDFVRGLPIGYGVRVPLIMVSPWTRGGWVNSDLSDHTSVIKFLEEFTGVQHPSISRWRRMLSSNLMSAFDFAHPDYRPPVLPNTQVLVQAADADYNKPAVPLPTPNHRVPILMDDRILRRRPGQYLVDANLVISPEHVNVEILNRKVRAAGLSIYANRELPFEQIPCTLPGMAHKTWVWPGKEIYDFSVYGPDGFLRRFSGMKGHDPITVTTSATSEGAYITLTSSSNVPQKITLSAVDHIARTLTETVPAHQSVKLIWPVNQYGYYDVKITSSDGKFMQRFAGRTR